MKYKGLINAYEEVEAQYPRGESFGVKKGHIPMHAGRFSKGLRGWLKVVEEMPEDYRSVAYEDGGVKLANLTIILGTVTSVGIGLRSGARRASQVTKAAQFEGTISQVGGSPAEIEVAGLFVPGVQREGLLRVKDFRDSKQLFVSHQPALMNGDLHSGVLAGSLQ